MSSAFEPYLQSSSAQAYFGCGMPGSCSAGCIFRRWRRVLAGLCTGAAASACYTESTLLLAARSAGGAAACRNPCGGPEAAGWHQLHHLHTFSLCKYTSTHLQTIQWQPSSSWSWSQCTGGTSDDAFENAMVFNICVTETPTVMQERLAAMFPQHAQPTASDGCTWMQWAFACVRSRAFQLGPGFFAFVPFMDMANHAVLGPIPPNILSCWRWLVVDAHMCTAYLANSYPCKALPTCLIRE